MCRVNGLGHNEPHLANHTLLSAYVRRARLINPSKRLPKNKSDSPVKRELQSNNSNAPTRAFVLELFQHGYTDHAKAYTSSIQANADKVNEFARVYSALFAEGFFDWDLPDSLDMPSERVEQSLEDMEEFLKNMGQHTTSLVVINHGHATTFEIAWIERGTLSVVWDRWTAEVDDAVMVYADSELLFDITRYRCEQKPNVAPRPPLYRYHPERFKANREYAEPVGKYFRQTVAGSELTVEHLNEFMGVVTNELNEKSSTFPRRLKNDHPHPSLVVDAEAILATAYGHFVQAGRQIVDFPKPLLDMLAKTDIDDIPLDSIKTPYVAQYLHFGPQPDMEIEPGWYVDGAYVEQRGAAGELCFVITAIPNDDDLLRHWYLFPEVQYQQDIVGSYRTMDLGTAIDMVLADRLAALRDIDENSGAMMQGAKDELNMSGAIPEGLNIVNVAPQLAILRDEIARRRHTVYKAALQLLVNALCYIVAYPDDIEAVWPQETPESLLQKLQSGTGKEKQRAQSKLTSLGFVPVHICGQRFFEPRVAQTSGNPISGSVATHWRRGHWRNQSHGPARSLRKLIWVMPVLVGAKDSGGPETGHLYLAS
jgi:hypothetical protein